MTDPQDFDDNVIPMPGVTFGRDVEEYHPPPLPVVQPTYPVVYASILDTPIVARRRDAAQWVRDCYWGARLRMRAAMIHATRSPLYYGRVLPVAPRGLWVLTRRWWAWVQDLEGLWVRQGIAVSPNVKGDDARAEAHIKADRARIGRLRHRRAGTLAVTAVVVVVGWWLWARYPVLAVIAGLAVLGGLGWLGTKVTGRTVIQPVAPPPAGRQLTNTLIMEAFAPLLQRGQQVVCIGPPRKQGDVWMAEVQLPAGLEPDMVRKRKVTIAQGLRVAADCLTVDPLPMREADVIAIYVSEVHPALREVGVSPVYGLDRFDAWSPVPLGVDPAGGVVGLSLPFTALLIGSVPRMGKTTVQRNILDAMCLDPWTRPAVWDFKGMGDFVLYEGIADPWVDDDDSESFRAFAEWLRWLRHDEGPRRAKVLRTLVRQEGADSKLSREVARDASLDVPLMPVVVDEFHKAMQHPKWGRQISDDLIEVSRVLPASGVSMVLATQRPDAETIPSQLRAVIPTRLSLYCTDRHGSEAVLGDKATRAGWNAAELPETPGAAIALGPGIVGGATALKTFLAPVQASRVTLGHARLARGGVARPIQGPAPAAASGRQGRAHDLVTAALAAWPHPEVACHLEMLAQRVNVEKLVLSATFRGLGLRSSQVKVQGVNRQGYYLADVEGLAR